jgi:hypothetical protein
MVCTLCQRLGRAPTVTAQAITDLDLRDLPEDLARVKKWRMVALRERHLLIAMSVRKELLVFDGDGVLIRRRPLSPALRLRRG